MKFVFDSQTLELSSRGSGYAATLGDRSVFVEVVRARDGRLDLRIDGQRLTAYVSTDGRKHWVTVKGRTWLLTRSSGVRRAGAGGAHPSGLAAPMPGQVRSLNVAAGEAVKKGRTVMILEAMKMEIRVLAPFDGVVASILVQVGQIVERDKVLMEIVEKREG